MNFGLLKQIPPHTLHRKHHRCRCRKALYSKMKFSTKGLYDVDSGTHPLPRKMRCSKRKRRNASSSQWKTPSLLVLAASLLASLGFRSPLLGHNQVLAEAHNQGDESQQVDDENNINLNGLDPEAQEHLNDFLEELNEYTYLDVLIQETNQKQLPQNHNRPPVMIGRRRSLLEHNVHRHYSFHYLEQLQEQTRQRVANQQEGIDNNTEQQQTSRMDTKRELQEAMKALLYQTPVDAHAKANPQRHRHNAATSNALGMPPFPPSARKANAELLRDMFYRSYNAYMEYSFPAAELLPLTCQPGTFDLIRLPALTLIDALDTLLVLGDSLEFAKSVERLRQFDFQHKFKDGGGGIFAVNQNVSVFETTIRVLGGLLSAHQMAVAYLRNKEAPQTSSNPHTKSSDNKLPLVSLKEVYSDPEDNYLIPSEDVLQILLEHQQKSAAGSQHPQAGADGTCLVSGQAPEAGSSNDEIQPPDAGSSSINNNIDWREHCGAGVLSLEDCAAAKSASKVVNHTAAAILRKQRLEREPQWEYDGFLLELALDIGERLLPAFETRTGIPYGTVNLLHGVPSGETTVASLAGGGTLSLEMELLSRLTGDLRFGRAAKLAIRGLWLRRSPLQLLGKHIDIQRGVWTENLSGIGSNSDSFLEYLLKHYLLFPEEQDFWVMLQASYSGIFNDARVGEWYADVDMKHGLQNLKGMAKRVLESLMAFYPGMQTLMGEFVPAARSMNSFFMVREFLGFLPERFSYSNWKVDGGVSSGAAKYPLRPELLESCYFMHRTTKRESDSTESSSSWQWAADFALHHLERLTRAKCGYASVRGLNPVTGNLNTYQHPGLVKLDNDMPSFFLSETIKYLYLTFDDDNIIHNDKDRDWIFTTEAHPIHYVPTFEKQQKATRTGQGDSPQLSSVKNHLRTKLKGLKLQREGLPKVSQPKVSSGDAVSGLYLMEELWSDSTLPRTYRESIHEVFQEINQTASRGGNSSDFHPLKAFFGTQEALLDSMPLVSSEHMLYEEDNNLAHITWNSLGLGSGYAMKKACANIYASEMTWVDALNGGVLDYTDTYVSAFSESNSDYPSSSESNQILLTSAEALSDHGSGIFLGNMNSVVKPDEVCHIARGSGKKTEKASGESALNQTPQTESSKSKEQATTGVQQVELAGIGTFDVSAFPEGTGFFMQHTESGESIMTTFISDVDGVSVGDMTFMVFASMPRNKKVPSEQEQESPVEEDYEEADNNTEDEVHENNASETEGDRPRSPWKKFVGPRLASWFKNRRNGLIHDGIDSTLELGEPERAVVIADLNHNAYHCEVNILRRPISVQDDARREEDTNYEEIKVGEPVQFTPNNDILVASFPCSPALFGPTHMSRLIETNGIYMEHPILVPDAENEFGCEVDDDDVVPTVTTASDEVPVAAEETGGAGGSDQEDEFTTSEEDSSCENKTIQLVQRGHCSFYSKAVNQKRSTNAAGVIVINTEDNELFVMSHGEEEQAGMASDDVPVSVLVTGLDGEEIMSLIQSENVEANSDHEVESYLLAQIHIFRQEVEFDATGGIATDSHDIVWPVVRGSEEAVQVFAEGGWGIHAMRKEGGSIKDSAGASDLQLFLLRHSE